jgi:hypothetical protein
MTAFFEWLADLKPAQGLFLLALIAAIMLVIPYHHIITAFIKHIIFPKSLKIHEFRNNLTPILENIDSDESGEKLSISKDKSLLITGTHCTLYWKVEGAYRIDIENIGKNLRGNAAGFIINSQQRHFQLTAFGFFGKKETAELILPAEELHSLETTPLSEKDHLVRPVPTIDTIPFSFAYMQTKPLVKTKAGKSILWNRVGFPNPDNQKIYSDYFVRVKNPIKKGIYKRIDFAGMMKSYSFSTSKYNQIIQELNQNKTSSL